MNTKEQVMEEINEDIIKSIYTEIIVINLINQSFEYFQKELAFDLSLSSNDYNNWLAAFAENFICFSEKDHFKEVMSCDYFLNVLKSDNEELVFDFMLLLGGTYQRHSFMIKKMKNQKDKLIILNRNIDLKSRLMESSLGSKVVDLQSQLKKQWELDNLTNIYNKSFFYKEAKELIANYPETIFALIRLDIEKFRMINDFFGREQGDTLLVNIAELLRGKFGDDKMVVYGRLESDEFCICIEYNEDYILDTIKYIEKFISNYTLSFEIITNFGICVITDRELSIDSICDRANLAINKIKGNYLQRYAYYDDELRNTLLKEQEITSYMNTALKNEQFDIYIQPKCNIATGVPSGGEALVRWFHPQKGIISPDEFIPLFEKNGFIMKLDVYVWEKVCQYLKKRHDYGKIEIPISVNISRVDLFNPRLCEIIIGLVEKYKIAPTLLELEITESAYNQNQTVLQNVMDTLQAYGFKILMDDFGSGYSSLNALKDMSVDVLKIDLKFLEGNDLSSRGGSIISSIIRMAKWLKLPVIVEGIETKQQVEFLLSLGCTHGQGYFFKKPLPVSEFDRYIEETRPDSIRENNIMGDYNSDIEELWNPNFNEGFFFANNDSPSGIFEYYDGQIEAIRLNDAYFTMIGMSREEFYFQSLDIMDLIKDEDQNIILDLVRTAIENKSSGKGIYRRLYKKGEYMWIECNVKYLASHENRHLIYNTMYDITAIKNKEIAMGIEHEMLVLLEKQTKLMVFEYDLIRDTLEYSRYSTKSGYESNTFVEFSAQADILVTFLSEESRKLVKKHLADIKKCKKMCGATFDVDLNMMMEHTKKFYVQYECVSDNNGKIVRVIGTFGRK